MQTKCPGGFFIIWVPKLLLPPVKIRIFGPKTAKFGPNYAFVIIYGQMLTFLAPFVPCPTNKAPNELARPICDQESIFWAKFGRFWAKNPNLYRRKQKFWYPHNGKPPRHLVHIVFWSPWDEMGKKCQ